MQTKTFVTLAGIVSAVALTFLFWLIYGYESNGVGAFSFLPAVNASLNTMSATCLVMAFFAIKKGNIPIHKKWMTLALASSALFLCSYILYHTYHGDTHFLGVGSIKILYFFILISHIILSVICLPLVFITYFLGFTNKVILHRKLAKITFPIWLYVSVSGVLVFLLLKGYS